MRIRLFAQLLQFACQTIQHASVLAKEGRFWARGTPESQTLIVPCFDPEAILVPSGENVTEKTPSLWALAFSATQLMSVAIILRTREKKRGL